MIDTLCLYPRNRTGRGEVESDACIVSSNLMLAALPYSCKYLCCRIYHGNILCQPRAELQWFQAVLLQAAPQQDGGRLPGRRGAQDQTC